MAYRIAVLQPSEELKHPLEKTFGESGHTLHFHDNLAEIIDAKEDYSFLIIDLDGLPRPLASSLQQLRLSFPKTERVALSSSDSSQLALTCVRNGFSDFLLKPLSPEELLWSIQRCQQRQEMIQRFETPNTELDFRRSINQISTASSPALAQLYALESLQEMLGAQGGAWWDLTTPESPQALVVSPKKANETEARKSLPDKIPKQLVNISQDKTSLLFPTQKYPEGAISFWGIRGEVPEETLTNCKLVLEHVDICLLNLQKMEDLKKQTFIDDLTGLYNSRFLKYAVTAAIQKCRKPEHKFSVLFIDVDHFKKINDSNNHIVGSEFLIAIGRTIRNAIRGVDPVFRYGGDEFVVLLNETGTEEAKEIAERIRKNIERRVFVIQKTRLQTTVSIGVATYPIHAKERETLLKMADEAMFSVKKSSRNAVHLAVTE